MANIPSLRRGRFHAAQLWKLDSIKGHYLPLGEMLAPYLGDVEAVVPYQLVQVYRHINTFRVPIMEDGMFLVPVWPEEVRGMPVRYVVNADNGHGQRRGRMMARATRRGYIDVFVEVRIDPVFMASWTQKFNETWPMVRTTVSNAFHPSLDCLIENTFRVHMAIINHNENRRRYWLARRTRMAAELGLRVDRHGRVRGDSSDEDL
jgi:hypothetical protein